MKSYEIRKTRSLLVLHSITNRMIAKRAGVSETFVSYVINGKRKGSRVQRIIGDMIREKSGDSSES